MEKWQCSLVEDFINDNGEISLLYMLRGGNESCDDRATFIQELKLESKFYIYCNIRANSN